MLIIRQRILFVPHERHIRYKLITYDSETRFSRATPAGRARNSVISTRNATTEQPGTVRPHVGANFARRWRIFSASTTHPAREGLYAREDRPTRSTDFHTVDAAVAAESGISTRATIFTYLHLPLPHRRNARGVVTE